MSQQNIGYLEGVTRERIRQIIRRAGAQRSCSVEGCGIRINNRSTFCWPHAYNAWRHGDPLWQPTPQVLRRDTHGTLQCYRRGNCRCDLCIAAYRAWAHKNQDNRLARAHANPDIFLHGDSGYCNWGCRCDVCTRAHSERLADQKTRLTALGKERPDLILHGTAAGLQIWGCHCELCRSYKAARRRGGTAPDRPSAWMSERITLLRRVQKEKTPERPKPSGGRG